MSGPDHQPVWVGGIGGSYVCCLNPEAHAVDLNVTARTKLAVDLISDVIRRLQHRCKINQDPHLLDWIGNLEDARNLLREVGE